MDGKATSPQPVSPAAPAAPAFGLWKSARVTDTERPMGRQFRVGERVYYRDGETIFHEAQQIAAVHVLKPGLALNGRLGVRRWVEGSQLDGATDDHRPDVGDAEQKRLTALWDALEPKHAGFHPGTRIPRRMMGYDVRLADRNPEVDPKGWQADTVFGAGAPPFEIVILERGFWVNAPKRPDPEQAAADIRETLAHEIEELEEKGELVDERWPNISDAARQVCLDEMEGIAHTITIGTVDGFYGPDANRRYLRESYYPMLRRWGFGARADAMEKTDL